MKMNDVFDLPFTADAEFQEIYDASGEPLPDFESVEKDKAVVMAINNHDALVELIKELVEALEEQGLDYCALINKAEELLKEQGE